MNYEPSGWRKLTWWARTLARWARAWVAELADAWASRNDFEVCDHCGQCKAVMGYCPGGCPK